MTDTVDRQNFQSYLAMVHNAVGTEMYRNFYIRINDGPVFDAIGDGENSCAFFVTHVLLMFGKQQAVHATVSSAINDLKESGWIPVAIKDLVPGDVLVWAGRDDTKNNRHIGFYIGNDEAISTSTSQQKVARHHMNFGELNREITEAYRMENW